MALRAALVTRNVADPTSPPSNKAARAPPTTRADVDLDGAQLAIPVSSLGRGRSVALDAGNAAVLKAHRRREAPRAANLALAAGVNPKVVSEQLGHATVSFALDTYSHVLVTNTAPLLTLELIDRHPACPLL